MPARRTVQDYLDERPAWPGGAELTYGHDLCVDPLPHADAATMFEVIEHLGDAPTALALAWRAVPLLIASFPNPVEHGSHHNPYHVNDWTLDEFEAHVVDTARERWRNVDLTHLWQPNAGLLVPGPFPASQTAAARLDVVVDDPIATAGAGAEEIEDRFGAIAPGEPIVLVAALSAHRAAAFAAVEELMDYLKTDAPFWKRETGPDGACWIEPTAEDRRRREEHSK